MKLSMDQVARELSAEIGGDLNQSVSVKQAKAILVRTFEYMAGSLAEGNEINVPGFGKFSVKDRPERETRNPSTGEKMMSPAKRVFKFSAAKALKDRIGG